MWLLGTMGCGRSKSASSNSGGGGAADTDNTDFYQKTPAGQGKKDSLTSDDDKQGKKTNSSLGDNNHRIKGQHTNGEVKSSKDSKDSHEKPSSGPLAPNAPPDIEDQPRRTTNNSHQKNITDSQIEFFRMLDEKIEKGQDFDVVSHK